MRSGYGFSKKIPTSLVRKIQTALDELLNEGVVRKIFGKYQIR